MRNQHATTRREPEQMDVCWVRVVARIQTVGSSENLKHRPRHRNHPDLLGVFVAASPWKAINALSSSSVQHSP